MGKAPDALLRLVDRFGSNREASPERCRRVFRYSEFGCIVDYLVESYGRARLLEYMKRLCKTSGHKGAFEEVFGIGFDTFIDQFREHVSSGRGGTPPRSLTVPGS